MRLTARSAASPTPSTSSAPAPVDPAQLPPALRDIIALFQLRRRAHRYQSSPRRPWNRHSRPTPTASAVRLNLGPASPRPRRLPATEADSDAQLTKGLAALLVLGLSGAPARDVAMVPVEFIEMLGIRQSLSPSRNIGLLNMINLMKLKALEIAAGQKVTASPEIRQERTETPTVEKGEPQFEDFGGQVH
ncbi:hypothetical protein ZWY2020_000784 [Hordeum vulgare]|nr:hypothetical protein ZWY2020_000784 [Hordeum vulgare]